MNRLKSHLIALYLILLILTTYEHSYARLSAQAAVPEPGTGATAAEAQRTPAAALPEGTQSAKRVADRFAISEAEVSIRDLDCSLACKLSIRIIELRQGG